VQKNAPYIDRQSNYKVPQPELCMIPVQGGCRVDDRADLDKSTEAAIVALKEAWDDETLAASGNIVAMTILSHNGGYNDKLYGKFKSYNVLPAFKRWSKNRDESEHHLFYGQNIRCPDGTGSDMCKSKLWPQTQHYAYTIISQHLLAACYYGKNYQDKYEEFRNWDTILEGYCSDLGIPDKTTVRQWGGGS